MWSPPSWVCNQHDLSLLIGQRPNKKRATTEPERQKWVIHRNPLCNGLTQNPKARRRRLLSSIIPQVYGRKAKRKRRWHKTWTSIIHRVLHHRPNACFSQKDHTFSSDITSSPLNYVSEASIAAFNEYSRYAYVPNGFFVKYLTFLCTTLRPVIGFTFLYCREMQVLSYTLTPPRMSALVVRFWSTFRHQNDYLLVFQHIVSTDS